MNITVDERVEKIFKKFSQSEKSRIARVTFFIQDRGFLLTENHLKKLTKTVWELRAGDIRLLFGVIKDKAIVTNVFKKKTQHTPINEISLAEKRLSDHRLI